jgi:hypothetical protein
MDTRSIGRIRKTKLIRVNYSESTELSTAEVHMHCNQRDKRIQQLHLRMEDITSIG